MSGPPADKADPCCIPRFYRNGLLSLIPSLSDRRGCYKSSDPVHLPPQPTQGRGLSDVKAGDKYPCRPPPPLDDPVPSLRLLPSVSAEIKTCPPPPPSPQHLPNNPLTISGKSWGELYLLLVFIINNQLMVHSWKTICTCRNISPFK